LLISEKKKTIRIHRKFRTGVWARVSTNGSQIGHLPPWKIQIYWSN